MYNQTVLLIFKYLIISKDELRDKLEIDRSNKISLQQVIDVAHAFKEDYNVLFSIQKESLLLSFSLYFYALCTFQLS